MFFDGSHAVFVCEPSFFVHLFLLFHILKRGDFFMKISRTPTFLRQRKYGAKASVRGSAKYPEIYGDVKFYTMNNGTLVVAEINGLPRGVREDKEAIFALHIHEGEVCLDEAENPFKSTRGHYNPRGAMHPYHSGDMPPLFSSSGYAFSSFLSGRFDVSEIIGKTVVIHGMPDDFKTAPSGNAGEKIACGVIRAH